MADPRTLEGGGTHATENRGRGDRAGTRFVFVTMAIGQDATKGKAVFAQYCGSCHGAAGKGDGAGAAALNPKPKDLTDGGYVR